MDRKSQQNDIASFFNCERPQDEQFQEAFDMALFEEEMNELCKKSDEELSRLDIREFKSADCIQNINRYIDLWGKGTKDESRVRWAIRLKRRIEQAFPGNCGGEMPVAAQDNRVKKHQSRGDITQKEAAALYVVSVRTIQNWIAGEGTPKGFSGLDAGESALRRHAQWWRGQRQAQRVSIRK